MKSWNQDYFYDLYYVYQLKKFAWSSLSVLHQRCISYLERDLAIFFSTSLSHDCVMFPIHVRTRRTYLGLYQFIRTAHPFSQNLSLEYCIRTSLCHWSLLDSVGRPRLLPDRKGLHLVHSAPALLRRPSPGRYPRQCAHGISVAIPLTRSSGSAVSRSRVPYPFCER